MKFKKLSLLSVAIVALLSASYSTVTSAAEKNSCDIMDAPNVDLTTITQNLQTRIDTLTQLQKDLSETKTELDSAATKEEWLVGARNITALIKAASAITLSAGVVTSEALAASPAILAATVLSNTTNFINDAINSNGKNQNEVLLDATKSYGVANIDLIGGQLTSLAKNPAFGSAWSSLSYSYTAITNLIDLSNTWDSKTALRSHVSSIDKQLNALNTKITALKTNLTKMEKLVGDNEKKLDKGFLDLINKAKKDTTKTCESPKKDGYTKIANNGSTLPDSAVLGSNPTDWACTKDNKTGLIWEVKTSDGGMRDITKTHTIDSSDEYIRNVNQQTLCGADNWRFPNLQELNGLVYCSDGEYNKNKNLDENGMHLNCTGTAFSKPTININYFPDDKNGYIFWSSSLNPNPVFFFNNNDDIYWLVGFVSGYDGYAHKNKLHQIRLVH